MPKPQRAAIHGQLSSALASFNLSDAELAVYHSTLELGCRQASQIAKHAGLNRPYTYDILSALAEKGLIIQSNRNSVKQFQCTPVEDLIDLLRRREIELSRQRDQLVQALPMLKQMRKLSTAQPGLRYFRGADGVEQLLNHVLSIGRQTIHSFVNAPFCGERLEAAYPGLVRDFLDECADREVTFRCLAPTIEGSASRQVLTHGRLSHSCVNRVRLSQRFPLESFIYGRNIALLPNAEEAFALVIENEAMTASALELHNLLWAFSEKGV